MAKRTFLIREAEYDYDTEKPRFLGWTKVIERAETQAEAQVRAQALSRERFSWFARSLKNWTWDDAKKQSAVLAVLERTLPEQYKAALNEAGARAAEAYYVLRAFQVPDKVSADVQDALLDAAGAKYFEAFAFSGEPKLLKPEIEEGFYGKGSNTTFAVNDEGFPWLCQTRKEAEQRVYAYLYQYQSRVNPFTKESAPGARHPPGLKGSYDELSSTPDALQALVAKHEKLFKKSDDGIEVLNASERAYTTGMRALTPLLRKPPFVVRELSFDEARKVVAKADRGSR